jgi:hypothetical protein
MMMKKAQHSGLISSLADHIVNDGISSLWYADDIANEVARNLKLLMYIFEAMSGLKMNFEKREISLVLADNEKQNSYADMFNCQAGF